MQSGEEVSAEQHLAIQEEEEQRRISSYEDVFRRIKDATGVSETKVILLSAYVKLKCIMSNEALRFICVSVYTK